jgi:hypothetical protein
MPPALVPGTGIPRIFFFRAGRLRPTMVAAAAPAAAVTTGTPTVLTAFQPAWPAVWAAFVTTSTGELEPLLDCVRALPVDDDRDRLADDDEREGDDRGRLLDERELPPEERELPLVEERDAVDRFCPWRLLEGVDRLPSVMV